MGRTEENLKYLYKYTDCTKNGYTYTSIFVDVSGLCLYLYKYIIESSKASGNRRKSEGSGKRSVRILKWYEYRNKRNDLYRK